jgi:hypothetical protein
MSCTEPEPGGGGAGKRPDRGRTGVDVWPRARGGRGEHEAGRTLRELARA